jgi:hypothetical protein
MTSMSRRAALTVLASTLAIVGNKDQRLSAQSADAPDANPPVTDWPAERAHVIAVGFTADEAECWELIARAAAKFFELPVLGELDKHEIAEATHVFQQKLLARPAYRSYVDLTKRQHAAP